MSNDGTAVEGAQSAPEPIDMKSEREQLVKNINNAYSQHIGGVPHEITVIVKGLLRLWNIVEHEIRRVDNEVTDAVTARYEPTTPITVEGELQLPAVEGELF